MSGRQPSRPGERRGPVTGRGSSGAPQVTPRRDRDLASELCHTLGCAVPTSASSLGLEELPLEPERRKEAKYQQPSRRLGRSAASPPPAARRPPPPRAPGGPGPAAPPRPRGRGAFAVPPPELRLRAAEETVGRAEAPGAVTTPFPCGLEAVHRCSADHELNASPRHS